MNSSIVFIGKRALRFAAAPALAGALCSGAGADIDEGRLPLRLAAAGVKPRVAAIVTVYYQNSHADVLVSRLLQTRTLDGAGTPAGLELAALYMDQVSERDIGLELMAEHGVPVFDTIRGALTLGGGRLAVDGVLLIAEHGDYPRGPTTQVMYPKRRFFDEITAVFQESGQVVPVFCDKHLADTWEDARDMLATARRLGFPMMAGSSLPVAWRRPPVDVAPEAGIEEIVGVSYHTLDSYGFHALEMVQCLVERRAGGETGIRAVRAYMGEDVWRAGAEGVYDPALLEAALEALPRRLGRGRPLREAARSPVLFAVEHADGLKVNVLTLGGYVGDWAAAWRIRGATGETATHFQLQRGRPFMHFDHLLEGITLMMREGSPAWPPERTLMTSGALDFLLRSKIAGGKRIETPGLMFSYRSDRPWRQPPPPPAGRPLE